VNEQQECSKCERIGQVVAEKVADDRLPAYPFREVGTAGAEIRETDARACGVCDEQITEPDRWLVHYTDRRRAVSRDLRMHDLCHRIWLERAARE